MWGSIIGAAAQIGSNIIQKDQANSAAETANQQAVLNSATAWRRSTRGATRAFRRSKRVYKRRYQWTTKDMRKAGLNPILAAGGGFNVGSGISAPAATATPATSHMATTPQPIDAPAGAKDTTQAFVNQKAITKTYNEAKHVLQQIAQSKEQVGQIAQQTLNLLEQHKKITQEIRQTQYKADLDMYKLKVYKVLNKRVLEGQQRIEKILPKLEQPTIIIKNYLQNAYDGIKHKFEEFKNKSWEFSPNYKP